MTLPRKKRADYLTPYRRHADNCTEKESDVRCDCPIWCQGKIAGKYVRESLNTRSMGVAEMKIKERLNPPEPDGPKGGLQIISGGATLSLQDAETKFLAAKKSKSTNTYNMYSTAVNHFRQYAEAQSVSELRHVTPDLIQAYFQEYGHQWPSVRTKNSRLTHLRVFFNYAVEMDWLVKSPAAKKALSYEKTASTKRKPFTPQQVQIILAAIELLPADQREQGRALILLLLYSGMRISDATFVQRASITKTRCLDYWVIKTRKRIALAPELHQKAVDALNALPASRVFFFQPDRDDNYREALTALHSGEHFEKALPTGLYDAAVRKTTFLVHKILDLAGLIGGPHHFRDTFAVNLLSNGGEIFNVSQMLGHSDVKITQKHYLKLVEGYVERMAITTRKLDYEVPAA